MTWNSNRNIPVVLEFWSTKLLILNLVIKTLEIFYCNFCISCTCWILTLVVYRCVIFYDAPGVSILVRQKGNKYWNSSIPTVWQRLLGRVDGCCNCNSICGPATRGRSPTDRFLLRLCAILAVSSISASVEHARLKPVIYGIYVNTAATCEPKNNSMEAVKAFNIEVCENDLTFV